MTVASVGRIPRFAKERTGRHEHCGTGNIWVFYAKSLSLAEDFVIGIAGLGNDNRQLWRAEVAAHIVNQMHKIRFVGRGRLFVAHVVPTLEPDETRQLRLVFGELREGLRDGSDRLLVLGDHARVVGTRLALSTRWPKVLRQTLATPRRLDQQYRVREVLADDVTKLQLRAEVMQVVVDRITDRKLPHLHLLAARAIPDDDV